ncbi:hypothetical protein FHS83_000677 [Rhizomicrobium palustre]|uniref:Uncharacterized protein n=1 Tax=Rhizomicrobium palustre TaxID=189966 RepID=A0A846MVW4_9PROT|nr:hypothetical protein [Rhizomicrobium palustre]NIK87359.1 hypothetical protein [Rhizomicrobium palustre]
MVALRLEDEGLDYISAKLDEAGGLASTFRKEAIWEPVVFVPDFADPLTLPDLDSGGVVSQEGANAEFVAYLHFLKQRNAKLQSLILADPFAQVSDLDYVGELPEELVTIFGSLNYVYDISTVSPALIWDYRAFVVSYLKLAYVSEMPPEKIRALAEDEPDDLFARLSRGIRHIAVNCYDDESWLVVRHEDK